jgi:hypothetical protein
LLLPFNLLDFGTPYLDKFCNLDSTVGIQDSCETFFLVVVAPSSGSKHTSDLRKDANLVNRLDVRNYITVRVFVLEEESTKVRLAAFHHLLDGSNNRRISYNDSLVKSWKERTPGYREGEHLRINFWYRLFSN